jgi:3-deoxy-D-manno-octulosonic-acid transferase
VTSFTPAGSQQVQQLWGARVQHCYLPLDNPIAGALFFRRLKPIAVVFMETELWPNLIAQANARHIPLLLVNARLSQKSVRAYQKFAGLMAPAVQRFSCILAQSHEDCARFIAVGADPAQCRMGGNLKYDIQPSLSTLATRDVLRPLVTGRKVWVIGSSHQDEELLLLDVACELCERIPALLIVWAPRHRERFTAVAEQLQARGMSIAKRSIQQVPGPQTPVWLLDTFGELQAFYAIADVCTVAGSFGQAGGHNPLEPALFNVATTVGPNMQNAAAITAELLAAQGLFQHGHVEAQVLVDEIAALLLQPQTAEQLGINAGCVVSVNQGATSQAVEQLRFMCTL